MVNYIKDNASKLNRDKAYVIGVLCGDACQKSNRYQIKLSVLWKDKEFAKNFANCFYRAYGIKRRPMKEVRFENGRETSYANVIVDSKPAYFDLRRYGNFSTFTWCVPEQIKNANKGIKKDFLQGYFDSDGSIDVKWHAATADSTNYEGLVQIVSLLKDFDVETHMYPFRKRNKTYYHLKIVGWYNLTKFKKIGFRISRKQKKLLLTLRNYKHRLYRHFEKRYLSKKRSRYTDDDVLREIKKIKSISSKSLAQALGVCCRHAAYCINRLSSRGILVPLTLSGDRRRREWKCVK
jgi:hypothetical protein